MWVVYIGFWRMLGWGGCARRFSRANELSNRGVSPSKQQTQSLAKIISCCKSFYDPVDRNDTCIM